VRPANSRMLSSEKITPRSTSARITWMDVRQFRQFSECHSAPEEELSKFLCLKMICLLVLVAEKYRPLKGRTNGANLCQGLYNNRLKPALHRIRPHWEFLLGFKFFATHEAEPGSQSIAPPD
jgi:hypothetical protein